MTLYKTRKTVDQTQGGLQYQHQMSENDDLSVMMYAGIRETTQYQSILASVQANPKHPGGVIDLTRHYQHIDTRWNHCDTLFSVPVTLTGGLSTMKP